MHGRQSLLRGALRLYTASLHVINLRLQAAVRALKHPPVTSLDRTAAGPHPWQEQSVDLVQLVSIRAAVLTIRKDGRLAEPSQPIAGLQFVVGGPEFPRFLEAVDQGLKAELAGLHRVDCTLSGTPTTVTLTCQAQAH